MPIRKCRATVAKSLDALCRQKTPARCEIIFVCDTREDDSLAIIRAHSLNATWDCVEIFHPGRGLAQAYNLGWQAAHAQYVFNMHSDCYPVDSDAMTRMVDWMEREGAIAAEPLLDIPQDDWPMMSFWDRVTSSQYRHARPVNVLMGKFDLMRRSALESVGGFDEEHFFSAAEDADIRERLLTVGRLTQSDAVVIHAHQHPPDARFIGVLRKHVQSGEGFGALLRKHWCSLGFLYRFWWVLGLDLLKLLLLLGAFVPPVSICSIALMMALGCYYARWAFLSRDWRVVLIPFAVSVMFAFFAIAMVCAFIRGRQSFDYIKAT